MRARVLLLYVLLPASLGLGIFALSHSYFRSAELLRAEGRLSLIRSTVIAELDRFSHLTFVLARDPYVIATATGGPTGPLNARLADFARRSGLDAIYLMRPDGRTISASNAHTPSSFVGQNYAFRPYHSEAIAGQQGRFYGIGSTTGLPGYFISDPVRDAGGAIVGAIAIKLDLTRLEQAWRDAGESVLLANRDGVVLLAADPGWRYRALTPLGDAQRTRIRAARQFGDQPLAPLDWRPAGDRGAVIGGDRLIHLTSDALPHDWVLHYFASEEPVTTRSWLVTGAAVMLAALLIIFGQVRRTARIGAALRRSEAEEAALRRANEQLAVEIDERRAAETRLQRTQDELARASRLAALGELAASVTHELGQPIAAMRNHLAAAEIGGAPAATLTPRIAGLVDRMEGITRQLKFFARSGGERLEQVDLRDAMQAAEALVAPNIAAIGAELSSDCPETPVIVHGNRLRLEQVLTNLLRNALDAMEDSDTRRLSTAIGSDGATAWVEIRDTGHGLGDASLSELQEPFVTSRESGRGMGLGLAISAGIVREHHGTLQARNRPGGGALFRVEIPVSGPEREAP